MLSLLVRVKTVLWFEPLPPTPAPSLLYVQTFLLQISYPSNSVMVSPSQRTLTDTVGTKKESGKMEFGLLTIWFARKKFSAGDIVRGTCGTDPSWRTS